jgi:hypothetical protein
MLMRQGSVQDALGFYERAVDMYAERGFLNNAIALCSKILRQSPGRTAVYYKLGRISARKGFKSDARKNFLEYADRMQKSGKADEAFRALSPRSRHRLRCVRRLARPSRRPSLTP